MGQTGLSPGHVSFHPILQGPDRRHQARHLHKSTPAYHNITSAVRTYADGFISVVQEYTPATGALSTATPAPKFLPRI